MMRPFLLAALLTVLALAGCFSSDKQEPAPPQEVAPTPSITALKALGQPTHVSTPGHRIAEFMVNRDPNDPDHLVTAFGDYDSPGGVLNCAFAVSFDGGQTWTVSQPIPDFSGPYLQFDGWVDFDEQGGVHGICLIQGGPGATAESWPFYFHSTDGGLTWTPALHIPTDPPGASTDKTTLAVGRDGTVYAAVSDMVGTTQDNGTTWVTMKEVAVPSDQGRGISVLDGMAEDNEGTVYLLGLTGGDIGVARTVDHGATWNLTTFGPFDIPPGYSDQNRWVDQRPWTALPNLAHNAVTDDLWVTWQTWDAGYGGYRLHLARSTDHGVTFAETPVPAFKSEACADPCHITHPAVAFDLQGRMGLIVQLTKDEGILKVVQFSASADQGTTWADPIDLSHTDGMDSWRSPGAFQPTPEAAQAVAAGLAGDPTTAHNVAVGVALTSAVSELQMRWNGEYWGLGASSKGFVAMWIDHSGGGRPQLWSQIVAVD